ncbi:MAG: hypothetical protein Q8R01_04835 [Ramlibacter sp.]|nr:hypothetical protein [Ramlibacter sp.]
MSQPPQQGTGGVAGQPAQIAGGPQNMLGIPMSSLAGLSVDDLLNNKPALTMVMHYYKQLADENAALKNDLNTAGTYVTGYEKKTSDTSMAAGLYFLSSLCIGLGANLLTSDNDKATVPGGVLLAIGVILQGAGLYYAMRKS